MQKHFNASGERGIILDRKYTGVIMPFAEELELHIRAGYPILYVPTFEEMRAEETIAEAAAGLSKPRKIQIWDVVNGFPDFTRSRGSPTAALEYIDAADESEPAIFVLRDFHRFLDNVQVARWLRELARTLKRKPHTVILLAPTLELPPDLAEDVSVLDMRPPTYEQIEEEINRLLKNQSVRLEVGGREALVKACQGLMMNRIQLVISKALAQHARIDHRAIHLALEEKKQRIRQTEVLEFYPVAETLDDVGGMDVLKMWLNRRATAFTEEARAYGLPNPKGVMLVGIQGTGKSLVAKTIANLWQLPLLRMDVGRLMGALVGQSEQRTREAIQIAEAMAPCVLWIDEIDKAFAGSASGSPVGDSGTSARVFGTVVTWMQEKTTPVFVTATANAIENLPPELLRKGRFDEIFFIGLPSEQEREEIFYVHLRRVREMRLREFDLRRLAAASDGYSGADRAGHH
jgi:ATP-dependent 26S proteasome regulatory subunit